MTLKEKLQLFKDKGWTCNPETGEVFSNTGYEYNKKNKRGYIVCKLTKDGRTISVKSHQLIWFLCRDEVPNVIDHINHITHDNRIINLRNVNSSENQWNQKNTKGYYKTRYNKFAVYITLFNKRIYIGTFKTESEAHQAYLEAKAKYHIID